MTHKCICIWSVVAAWRCKGSTKHPQDSPNPIIKAQQLPVNLSILMRTSNHTHKHSPTTSNAASLQSSFRRNLVTEASKRTTVLPNPPLRHKIGAGTRRVYGYISFFDLELFSFLFFFCKLQHSYLVSKWIILGFSSWLSLKLFHL